MTFLRPQLLTSALHDIKIVLISLCIVHFTVVQSKITPTQCNEQIPARAIRYYADRLSITISLFISSKCSLTLSQSDLQTPQAIGWYLISQDNREPGRRLPCHSWNQPPGLRQCCQLLSMGQRLQLWFPLWFQLGFQLWLPP